MGEDTADYAERSFELPEHTQSNTYTVQEAVAKAYREKCASCPSGRRRGGSRRVRKYLLFTLIPVRFTRNIFLHGPTIRTYSPPTRARRVDSPAHHVPGSASGISACGALIGGSGCSRLLVAVVVLSVAASAATAIAGHRHPPAPRPPPPPPPPPPPCTRATAPAPRAQRPCRARLGSHEPIGPYTHHVRPLLRLKRVIVTKRQANFYLNSPAIACTVGACTPLNTGQRMPPQSTLARQVWISEEPC